MYMNCKLVIHLQSEISSPAEQDCLYQKAQNESSLPELKDDMRQS